MPTFQFQLASHSVQKQTPICSEAANPNKKVCKKCCCCCCFQTRCQWSWNHYHHSHPQAKSISVQYPGNPPEIRYPHSPVKHIIHNPYRFHHLQIWHMAHRIPSGNIQLNMCAPSTWKKTKGQSLEHTTFIPAEADAAWGNPSCFSPGPVQLLEHVEQRGL